MTCRLCYLAVHHVLYGFLSTSTVSDLNCHIWDLIIYHLSNYHHGYFLSRKAYKDLR